MNVSPEGYGTVKLEGALLSAYPATSLLKNDRQVQLEAVPAPGYIFIDWSGDILSTANPLTVVMDCNRSIVANFAREGTLHFRLPFDGWTIGSLVLAALLTIVLIVRYRRS